jgi:hypothetical protein
MNSRSAWDIKTKFKKSSNSTITGHLVFSLSLSPQSSRTGREPLLPSVVRLSTMRTAGRTACAAHLLHETFN